MSVVGVRVKDFECWFSRQAALFRSKTGKRYFPLPQHTTLLGMQSVRLHKMNLFSFKTSFRVLISCKILIIYETCLRRGNGGQKRVCCVPFFQMRKDSLLWKSVFKTMVFILAQTLTTGGGFIISVYLFFDNQYDLGGFRGLYWNNEWTLLFRRS